jgi:hypothetical protein
MTTSPQGTSEDPHGARLQALSRPAGGEDDYQDHHWMLVGDERQEGERQGRPRSWLARIRRRPQPQDRLPPLLQEAHLKGVHSGR